MTESSSHPTHEVINNSSRSRFEVHLGSKVAVAEYIDRGHMIVFTHTEVPSGMEGQGVGGLLVRTGLDFAREGKKVVLPLCPFFAGFIRKHPEYQDLVLPGFQY